ncbi:MAG: oligoendopeptidase F [Calditrichia bacterium]
MKGKGVLLILLMSLLFSGTLISGEKSQRSMSRDEIPEKYKWNLSDIYPNWEAWEKGYAELEKKMDEIASLKGTLKTGPEQLLKAQKLQDEMNILAYRVYRYPQLMRDTDTRNAEVSARLQKVQILFARFSTATSWIAPEMLEIPWETMKQWLDSTPELAPYRFGIEDLYRQQAHVLDEDKEKLLSYFSQFRSTPRVIYTELSTSDIKFPTVKLSDGSEVELTRGTYSKILATNRNQADRKLAFEKHYQVFADNQNTYAAIYNAVCQRDWAGARARNYNSCLEAALEGDNIPTTVYENLINTVKQNTAPLQRYMKLRKKALGLEEYHSYDGSIPLVDFDKTYPYEEAVKLVKESVKPLGKAYAEKLAKAVEGGWIDVFENPGKRAGAYSAGVYGVHPYMLLNYNETLDYVFTLGHELGHTMHTTLSNENQPFATSGYTIFVAEVASTFNERLLLDYMLSKTKDPKERIALIQQAIRGITGTFYFQTLLADFEYTVHKMVENGQPITAAALNNVMKDLAQAYYGDAIEHDELLNVVWARIPHIFRTPYYVYQYATCFASSAQLYQAVTTGSKKEREAARERYLELLKSGGNDYPMNQLKKAGVDLTRPEPILAVIQQFDELVSLLERELDKIN